MNGENKTGDLFGDLLTDNMPAPSARNTDPITSHQAAADASHRLRLTRRAVLLVHDSNPDGLTDYELAALVGLQQNSAGKRRGDLRDAGYIEATEKRRPAPSGSLAIVWRITADGVKIAKVLRPHEKP